MAVRQPSTVPWAYHIAKQAAQYPELVDPKLYAQAEKYARAGLGKEIGDIVSPTRAAELLYAENWKFRGWSREAIFESLYGYQAKYPEHLQFLPTIQKAQAVGLETTGPKFVERWNKAALLRRLQQQAVKGPYEPVPLPIFYQELAQRAKTFGLRKELASRMGAELPQGLREALFPPTLFQKTWASAKALREAPTGWKIGVGAAVGILGLYALQPGSWFSGKDDDYNTIEGLGHSGIAHRMRRQMTDFGSGWRGILGFVKGLLGIGPRIAKITPARLERVQAAVRRIADPRVERLTSPITKQEAAKIFQDEVKISKSKHIRTLKEEQELATRGETLHREAREQGRIISAEELAIMTDEEMARRFAPRKKSSVDEALRQLQESSQAPKIIKPQSSIDKDLMQILHQKAKIQTASASLRPGRRHLQQTGKTVV